MEYRLHGIGDHKASGALGSLPLSATSSARDGDHVGAVDAYTAPIVPDHGLRLLVWSRFSRESARYLWFIALPFTLVNVAAEMRAAPPRTDGEVEPGLVRVETVDRRIDSMTRYVLGPMISVGALLWVVAWVETVLRQADLGLVLGFGRWNGAARSLGLLLAAVLSLVVILRGRLRPAASVSRGLVLVHVGALLATGAALTLLQPATIQLANPGSRWLVGWLDNRENYLDPIRLYVLAGTLAVIAWWLALGWASRNGVYRKLDSAAWWGSGFAVTAAFVLLNAGGSILRLGLDWLSRYIRLRVEGGTGPPRLASTERSVLPLNRGGMDEWVDLIPVAVLPLLLVVALWVLYKGKDKSNSHGPGGAKGERMRLVHQAISRLSTSSGLMAVAGPVLVWLAFVFLGWRLVSVSDGWRSLAVVIVHILGAVLTIWFVTGGAGGGRLTQILSSVADVLGFWPVRSHPLAGLSYRQSVVEDLRTRIREQQDQVPDDVIVLVGHSQGSVLAAWTVAGPPEGEQDPPTPKTVHLVTCGSPLRSLYGTFFTSTFSPAFFQHVTTHAAGWVNVWRDTDPIATPIPGASNEKVADTERVRGHSDYWVEPVQIDRIASWHARVVEDAGPAAT